mmetsp:Transcript_36561/g.79648  ORF Transcript_36561/g.79648 Transcript_36561/m.79648 type:complete len:594 (-) Transcript_36561:252-2033(-)
MRACDALARRHRHRDVPPTARAARRWAPEASVAAAVLTIEARAKLHLAVVVLALAKALAIAALAIAVVAEPVLAVGALAVPVLTVVALAIIVLAIAVLAIAILAVAALAVAVLAVAVLLAAALAVAVLAAIAAPAVAAPAFTLLAVAALAAVTALAAVAVLAIAVAWRREPLERVGPRGPASGPRGPAYGPRGGRAVVEAARAVRMGPLGATGPRGRRAVLEAARAVAVGRRRHPLERVGPRHAALHGAEVAPRQRREPLAGLGPRGRHAAVHAVHAVHAEVAGLRVHRVVREARHVEPEGFGLVPDVGLELVHAVREILEHGLLRLVVAAQRLVRPEEGHLVLLKLGRHGVDDVLAVRAPLPDRGDRGAHVDGLLQGLDLLARLHHGAPRPAHVHLSLPDGRLQLPLHRLLLVDALLQRRHGFGRRRPHGGLDGRDELGVVLARGLGVQLLLDRRHVQARGVLKADLLVAVRDLVRRPLRAVPAARGRRRPRRLRALQEAALRGAEAHLVRVQRRLLEVHVLAHLPDLALQRGDRAPRRLHGVAELPLPAHDHALLGLQGQLHVVAHLLPHGAPLALREAPGAQLEVRVLGP